MTYSEWDAYAATRVEVRPLDSRAFVVTSARIGISGEWPFPAHAEAWVLTACNPRSVQLTDAVNAARHDQLRIDLAACGAELIETTGRDVVGDWQEPGYVVLGVPGHVALGLAERYEQNAVFHWTPTEWAIHGVLQPGHRVMGWTRTHT